MKIDAALRLRHRSASTSNEHRCIIVIYLLVSPALMIFRLSYVNSVYGKLNICRRGLSVWARLRYDVSPTNIQRTNVHKTNVLHLVTFYIATRSYCNHDVVSRHIVVVLLNHLRFRYLRFSNVSESDFIFIHSPNIYFPVTDASLFTRKNFFVEHLPINYYNFILELMITRSNLANIPRFYFFTN